MCSLRRAASRLSAVEALPLLQTPFVGVHESAAKSPGYACRCIRASQRTLFLDGQRRWSLRPTCALLVDDYLVQAIPSSQELRPLARLRERRLEDPLPLHTG
jgi:hypothetical protein